MIITLTENEGGHWDVKATGNLPEDMDRGEIPPIEVGSIMLTIASNLLGSGISEILEELDQLRSEKQAREEGPRLIMPSNAQVNQVNRKNLGV